MRRLAENHFDELKVLNENTVPHFSLPHSKLVLQLTLFAFFSNNRKHFHLYANPKLQRVVHIACVTSSVMFTSDKNKIGFCLIIAGCYIKLVIIIPMKKII